VFPYGAHLAVVRVDRDTGKVDVERFMVAYDVGRAVNPMLVTGQLVGGCAQGLGGALLEEFVYDETASRCPRLCRLSDAVLHDMRMSRCCSPRVRRLCAIRSGSRARGAASTVPAA
jgi:hypothetical protein